MVLFAEIRSPKNRAISQVQSTKYKHFQPFQNVVSIFSHFDYAVIRLQNFGIIALYGQLNIRLVFKEV